MPGFVDSCKGLHVEEPLRGVSKYEVAPLTQAGIQKR